MSNLIPFNPEKKVTDQDVLEWKKTHLGFVYVILDNYGRIKIGSSLNPTKRVATVSSASGVFIEKSHFSGPCLNYIDTEKKLHKSFAKYNTHGEWHEGVSFDEVVKAVESYPLYTAEEGNIKREIIETMRGVKALADIVTGTGKPTTREYFPPNAENVAAFNKIKELMFSNLVFYESDNGTCIVDNRTEWLKASEKILNKHVNYYRLPEKAIPFATIHKTDKRHEDGTEIIELRWKDSIVDRIQAETASL